MADAPYAPWVLSGEALVAVVPGRRARGLLPPELRPLPGPVVVAGVRYSGSPVGPYHELAVGEPARLGTRPGLCITTMVVDSAESRAGGRLNWGYPKQLGTLLWDDDGDERELRWLERNIAIRVRPVGPPAPVLVPLRALQRRSDGPVVVPGRLRGRVRLARAEIAVPGVDALAALAGRRVGAVVQSLRFSVLPARRPIGRWASP